MRTRSLDTRMRWIQQVLITVLVLVVGAPAAGATYDEDRLRPQNTPIPPPERIPVFYNATNLFTEDQMAVLLHDAFRLTRIEIPTLIFLRIADSDHADPQSNRAFADTLRETWGIASSPGTDDGLVLLVTLDKQGHHGHSLTLSYGAKTFAESGLTPDYIAAVFEEDVLPRFAEGHYYEGMYVLMRRVRYGGIYFPPPVAPLDGAAKTLHTALPWIAPLAVAATAAAFLVLSLRIPMHRPERRRLVRALGIGVGLLAVALGALSVVGRSEIGVASTLLVVAVLGLQLWVWTRPATPTPRAARILAVSPTSRHLRRLARPRRMAHGMGDEVPR